MKEKVILICIALITFHNASAQEIILDEDEMNKANNFYNSARTEYANAAFTSSLVNFKNAYAINPNNADYVYGVATSFYELKKYDSALHYIDIAIEMERLQPDYHLRAGNIHFHMKNYSEAVSNYKIALENISEEFPINVESCLYNKSVSEFYLKRYGDAVVGLTQLIEIDSMDYHSFHLRGVSLLKLQQHNLACKDLSKALDLGNTKSLEYIDKFCNTH